MKFKLLSLCIIAITISMSYASYIYISLDDIVKESEIVLIGKMDSIKFGEPSFDKNNKSIPTYQIPDTGYIAIQEKLQNNISSKYSVGDKIPLVMPSYTSKSPNDMDRRFELNTKGIWMLRYKANNFYRIGHPDEFQEMKIENKIRDIIKKQSGFKSLFE